MLTTLGRFAYSDLPHRAKRSARWTARALVAVWLLAAPGLAAVKGAPDDKQPIGAPAERLQKIQDELRSLQTTQKQRAAAQARLAEEMADLKKNLVETASRIQALEAALFDSEQKYTRLRDEQQTVSTQMEKERDRLYMLLAAMQSLERQRPPALVVSPDDAVDAVRSAIVMDDILPGIKDKADQLVARTKELADLRRKIVAERTRITEAEVHLSQEKEKIETYLEEKAEQRDLLQSRSSDDAKRMQALAKEATTLKKLIEALDRQEQAAGDDNLVPEPERSPLRSGTAMLHDRPASGAESGNASKKSQSGGDVVERESEKTQERLAALPVRFSQALGQIALPVAGTIKLKYGKLDELGQRSQGLTIATRANAQVVAPFGGKVVYAGPFSDFEELLLIEAGEGYHIILTGMSKIYASVGDLVSAGEPVGVMGDASSESGPNPNQPMPRKGRRDPQELYMEFRKNGDPINPQPWLVSEERKVSG